MSGVLQCPTLWGDVFVCKNDHESWRSGLREDSFGAFLAWISRSTRLDDNTATVWNLTGTTWQTSTPPIRWSGELKAAKYDFLQGDRQSDRLATVTPKSMRVWDSNSDQFLVDTNLKVTPSYNTGLLWSNHHHFFLSDGKIKAN